jgi:hypothetical protein
MHVLPLSYKPSQYRNILELLPWLMPVILATGEAEIRMIVL